MEYFIIFAVVGFIAQMIDGALGMAYGVSSTSFLLGWGISPAIAGATVKVAEAFTTLISGLSHFKFKNLHWDLLKRLVIPGVIGGVIGAYILTHINGDVIKPYISGYLLLMGLFIIYKAFAKKSEEEPKIGPKRTMGLGFAGGLCDAIGGGGWGPVVTTTLVAIGHKPRFAIGTVNIAEFFVTMAQAATFITILGLGQNWLGILGLALGGMLAAPLAAYACAKLPAKAMMVAVGAVIIFLNVRTLGQTLYGVDILGFLIPS